MLFSPLSGPSRVTITRSASTASRVSFVIPEGPEREDADDAPPFKIAPVPNKGKGVLASQPLRKGTVVLQEPPLFTLGSGYTNSAVLVALAAHPREAQCTFFALANAYRGSMLPALGIFETNALPCDAPGEERMGLFLTGARFNHSCSPNVGRVWDAQAQTMVFRMLRNVADGEELSVNYVDLLDSRDERRGALQECFGFNCVCQVCALEGEALVESDRRRTTVKRLYEEVGGCSKEPTLGMRKARLALQLLREENLVHYEASFCFDAFQFCVLVSDFANAKLWARRAFEASCNVSGPESPAARTFKMYWANPRTHPFAGRSPKTVLVGPEPSTP